MTMQNIPTGTGPITLSWAELNQMATQENWFPGARGFGNSAAANELKRRTGRDVIVTDGGRTLFSTVQAPTIPGGGVTTPGGGGTPAPGLPPISPSPGFPQSLIDEDPELAFLTHLKQQNLPTGTNRFLQGKFGDIYGQYQSQLGEQLTQGNIPTTSFFNQFLPQFNLQDYSRNFAPRDRGFNLGRSNPRTRFLF